jgi:hypothetical protein
MYENTNFPTLPTCDNRLPNVTCSWSQGLYWINPSIHKKYWNFPASHLHLLAAIETSRDILIAKGYVTVYTELYCTHKKYIYFILRFIFSLSLTQNSQNRNFEWQKEMQRARKKRIVALLYLLSWRIYILTYSMEQSPSWEANWFCS